MHEKMKSETRITRLLDSAKNFSAFLELRGVFSAIADEVINIARYDVAFLSLLSETRDTFEIVALDHTVPVRIKEGALIPAANSMIGLCAGSKKGIVISNAAKHGKNVSGGYVDAAILENGRIVCAIALPIMFEQEIIGVFFAGSGKENVFGEAELNLFEQLSSKLSESIHGSYLYKRIRESENFYRMLVENVQDGLFIVQDEKMVFLNDVFAGMLGYRARDLFGMNIGKLIAPEDRDLVVRRYRDRVAGKDVPGKYELKLIHRDQKTIIPAYMNVSMLTDNGRHIAVGTLRDLSEVRNLQENLIRTERLASAGLLAASIAHEINNPLGIIHGFVEHIMAKTPKDDSRYEDLNIVLKETQKCSSILKNLLNSIKVQPLTITQTNLRSFVKETVQLLEKKFEEKKLVLNLSMPQDPPEVSMDFSRLRQVIINVLLNSIQSTTEGGKVDFTVGLSGNKDKKELSFTIEDNGEGMPEEYVDKVFEPFFSMRKQGTGLGLFTSRLITEAHGGSISFESKVKKGSKCVIRIPV